MPRRKILFVCVGNSCRSQMAEGFARAYGSDIVEVFSAGLAAAAVIAPETHAVMLEKNIDLGDQFPKHLGLIPPAMLDLVVNISGFPLPPGEWKEVITWDIPDPIGKNEKFHREVRDRIQAKVLELLALLRQRPPAGSPQPSPSPSGSSRVRFGRLRR